MRSAKPFGSMIGLILGITWMWLGFGAALLVALLGLMGWYAGGAIAELAEDEGSIIARINALLGRRMKEEDAFRR